jgi:phage gp16-like protein
MNAAFQPPAGTTPQKPKRRKQDPLNQAIQIARRQLGLDDATYASFLRGITGEESTTAMNRKQRYLVLEQLKKDGFKVGRPGDAAQDQSEQALLVRHKWLMLKHYGILRDPSERALLKYVRRITKVDRMEWLKSWQMNLLVEAIKKWVARVERELLQKAVADGLISLPFFCATFEDAEFSQRTGVITAEEGDALYQYNQACEAYLANYTPPKE